MQSPPFAKFSLSTRDPAISVTDKKKKKNKHCSSLGSLASKTDLISLHTL